MNKTVQAIVIIIVVVAGAYFLLGKKANNTNTGGNTQQSSIAGCYVAHLAQDVYTLKIQSENGGTVSGTLAYKNFEKDSSSGTFTGNYQNGILLGDYSFDSEGMHSVRQVIFKKQGNSFVEGFGDVTMVGNRETLTDPNNVTYDSNLTFTLSPNCL